MTQPWLCSSRFKLISVGLEIHGWLCKAIQFVANDPVKFNNAISTCLINLNVILYIFFLIKYSWMLSISSFSVVLWSTEKS